MLDLLISYLNFLILSISYIVKLLSFRPPNPPKYIISQNNEEGKEDICFLFKKEDNTFEYRHLSLKYLDIEFYKLRDYYKNDYCHFLPILILTPLFNINKCMIYCQGNSGDLGTSFFECYEIALRSNCIIVTFEYPGYGLCKEDEITEGEFYRRIKRIYHFVTRSLKFSPKQIILYGFSLGTGITFDFACKNNYPVAGLILQSPFLSIVRTIFNIRKTQYFDLFNNCDKAKNLCTKTLFIHGINDSIIPFIHGKILSKLIPEKYFYDFEKIENGNHNNLLKLNKDLIFQKINNFISDCTSLENIDNNSMSNYYENEELTDMNPSMSNIEDTRKKIFVHSSLIKSEYLGFNKSDDLRKSSNSFDIGKDYEHNIKASSQINYSLANNLKFDKEKEKENININNINNVMNMNNNRYIQNELSPIKPSYNNLNYINGSIYVNKQNLNINNNNNQNNYYYVNLGTSNSDNNYGNHKINTNNNNTTLTMTRSSLIENSLLSGNSSTNNAQNSIIYKKN